MKYVIVTDTHLGLYNSSDFWHDITESLFAEIHDVCFKNDINFIIHGGDFFHDRKSINTKTLDRALRIAYGLEDLGVYIACGNHDTYFKNQLRPSTLQIFESFPNIHPIYEPTKIDENIIVCPWSTDMEAVAGQYTSDHYIIGHFDINGFYMNNSFVCDKGKYNKDVFRKFKRVFSGHFHMPSQDGNIVYLGSPYGQSFNDIEGVRGYYVFDSKTGETEFFEFKSAPKFVKMTTENIDPEKIKGNIVKLIYATDYGNTKNQRILDEVMSIGPIQLNTDFSNTGMVNEEKMEEAEVSMLDHPEIIKEFIDKMEIDRNINKKTLVKIFDTILEEIA